jgi:hypothetical protein
MPLIKGMAPKSPALGKSAINFIHCKAVGKAQSNRNSSSGQGIIDLDANASDPVYFTHEKNKSFGLNAMAVHLVKNDKQIGYLPMYIAEDMTERLDRFRFTGVVTKVAGGDIERPTLDVNLAIINCPKRTTQEELGNWIDAHASQLLQIDADIGSPESKTPLLLWACWALAALVIGWIIADVLFDLSFFNFS